MNIKQKFKKGAASFYIVAFSTLILLIVVTSFAAIIISEIERTSNADLSQSAYDSAMAGVEDAKLAFYNYQSCLQNKDVSSDGLSCETIIEEMEKPLEQQSCDMVGSILGRAMDEGGGVVLEESNISNNMQQLYTCVKMTTVLDDYRSTVSSQKVVKVKFDDVAASKIDRMTISWYLNKSNDGLEHSYKNFINDKVAFPSANSGRAVPPTISLAMVQTAGTFSLSDFDMTQGDRTNRGMVYLVPIGDAEKASKRVEGNYIGAFSNGENRITASDGFLKSNDKTATNVPFGVYCPEDSDSEFACSATIELPQPINGERNDDTFMFVVGLPYGSTPETEFNMQFFCAGDELCATKRYLSTDENGNTVEMVEQTNQVSLKNVQIGVDSTGRANDLYRRVETRLEAGGESSYLSLLGPLELFGNNNGGSGALLEKNYAVTTEYNF